MFTLEENDNFLYQISHGNLINVGKLLNLNNRELFLQYSDDIWDMLTISYESIGGLKTYRSKKDFLNKGHFAKIVLDDNGNILACETYRKIEGSFKVVSYGCDQTPIGKTALQQIIQDEIINFDLHYWAEVSDAIEHYFKKYNGFPMPNTIAHEILGINQSEITISKTDAVHYDRNIGINKEPFTKMIFGIKDVETFEKAKKMLNDTYGNFMEDVNKLNESVVNKKYTLKQIIYIIENLYRLHDEEGINELIPRWYDALQDSLKILKTSYIRNESIRLYGTDDVIDTYINYANYLLDQMPLLKLCKLYV